MLLLSRLHWLYNASDVLLPKIYFYNFEDEVPLRRVHVYAAIREANLVKRSFDLLSMPIYAYAKFEYDVLFNSTTGAVEDLFYSKVSFLISN